MALSFSHEAGVGCAGIEDLAKRFWLSSTLGAGGVQSLSRPSDHSLHREEVEASLGSESVGSNDVDLPVVIQWLDASVSAAGGRPALVRSLQERLQAPVIPYSLQYCPDCLPPSHRSLVVRKADVVVSLEVRDGAAEVLEGFPDHRPHGANVTFGILSFWSGCVEEGEHFLDSSRGSCLFFW